MASCGTDKVLVRIALNFAVSAFSHFFFFFFFLHFTRFAEQGDKQHCSGTVTVLFMGLTATLFIKKY